MHTQPLLRSCSQRLSRGSVPDLGFEACSLALQIDALGVELGEPFRLADANRSAPHYGQRDNDEGGEHDPNQGPAAHSYAALCHARSLALRERGLTAVSLALAVIARLVSKSPSALPLQVQ